MEIWFSFWLQQSQQESEARIQINSKETTEWGAFLAEDGNLFMLIRVKLK